MKKIFGILFLFVCLVLFCSSVNAQVFPCVIEDEKVVCIIPENGMEYKVNKSDIVIGFTVPFTPENCNIKKGDGKFKPVDCDKIAEEVINGN